MRVLRRTGLLAGALGLAVTTAVGGTTSGAYAAESPAVASIQVHGTLMVAESDGPAGGSTSYAVELADGDLVPVRGHFPADARTGATFSGRLALPASVARLATSRSAALRVVEHRMLTLSVVGTPTVTAAAAALTPTVHKQFVAAIDNKGALGQDDATLLAHVSTVGSYWQDQSNGAISSLVVPSTVTHYNTSVALADCGLGSDFSSVVTEAKSKFPAFNQAAGDQLVLFVPDACSSGGVVGEGSVGSSFASGGVLIVKANAGIDGIYGHETGHNYGFGHAYARWSGTALEYYGVYDVMGFAVSGAPGGGNFNQLTALSTPLRVFQGVTDPGEIQDVALGDHTQPVAATATIRPRTDSTGLRSVRVVDPDTAETLYLDYRSGGGRDVGSVYAAHAGLDSSSGPVSYAPGVVIAAAHKPGVGGVDDLVLDAAGDTSLAAGGTWTNASGTLTVHVSTIGAPGAAVTVDFTPPTTAPFTTLGTPVIGGTVAVGGTVTLDPGTWSPTPTTTTIRWTAAGSPVANTDDTTSFVPSPALVGKQLVATVTESAPGFRSTVQSAPVTVSPGTIPVTANPTVTGTAQVGSTLQGHSGTWGSVLSTVASTWQWRANGTDIPGATSLTYTVQPGDVGKTLSLAQHLTATAYQATTIISGATGAVASGTIPVTANPTVTGTALVGSTLQGHSGTWGALLSPVSSTWQWRADGTDIPDATSLTYTVQPGDVGKTLSLAQHLTATGYQATTIISGETAAVPAPVISPAPTPTVSGTPRVGAPLQTTTGTWMTGVTLSYQWYVDGSPVSAATSPSYTPGPADLGKPVHVAVTGTRLGYPDATTTSADTAVVGLGVLTTAKPAIGGKALVGRTLTARPGTWTSGTTFTYAWFADGVAIKHATAKKLVLAKAQKGKRISVRVTGTKAAFTSVSQTSARTLKVT